MRKLEQEIYAIQKHELGPGIVNQPITESFALLSNEVYFRLIYDEAIYI